MSRRQLLIGGGALLASGGAFALSERRLRVTYHSVAWRGPKTYRVAHLTDVHVGWSTPRRILESALRAVHDAKPDVVVLTGDYVNHSLHRIDRLAWLVEQLPGPIVATLGNHDHWTDARHITKVLERAGARVLQNTNITVDGLPIVGIDDSVTQHHDTDAAFFRASGRDRLVLTHSPAIADGVAARDGARLILSGHTHAGQVRIPMVTKAIARRRGMPHLAGRANGEALLYVNAGLGHTRRGLRYGRAAAAEVAIFDLVKVVV